MYYLDKPEQFFTFNFKILLHEREAQGGQDWGTCTEHAQRVWRYEPKKRLFSRTNSGGYGEKLILCSCLLRVLKMCKKTLYSCITKSITSFQKQLCHWYKVFNVKEIPQAKIYVILLWIYTVIVFFHNFLPTCRNDLVPHAGVASPRLRIIPLV